MSAKKNHTMSAGILAGVLALITTGFFTFIADHNASAIALLDTPATGYPASQSIVPRITVIVDGEPPLVSSTGIALSTSGTSAWVTEELAHE